MKFYNIYPNFQFRVEAESLSVAEDIAHDLLKRGAGTICGALSFDFDIEEDITEESCEQIN